MCLLYSSKFLSPIYLDTRAGNSYREDFWKILTPINLYKISLLANVQGFIFSKVAGFHLKLL